MFSNATRYDMIHVRDWAGRIVTMTGMDLLDVDVNTENHLFGGIFHRVMKKRGKEVSLMITISLYSLEPALD